MKLIKNTLFKRIIIYLCCTFLFASSVFMSYRVPVYAKTTYADLLEDAVYIAGAAAGIFFSGGALTPALLIPFIEKLAGTGFDIYDYVIQDEEKGTTTISADFVNLVLQAYKQYQEENGVKFDGTMGPNGQGYYCFSDFAVTFYNYIWEVGNVNYCETRKWTDICTKFPCAALIRSGQHNGIGFDFGVYIVYYNKELDEFYCFLNLYENGSQADEIINPISQQFINGYFFPSQNITHMQVLKGNGNVEEYDNVKFESTSVGFIHAYINPSDYSISASSSSIPIYNSLEGLKQGLRSGDFSGAYNYGKTGEFEAPSYTGTYTGGDITILTDKLDALRDKIKELEDSNKSLEEKLKELLEWLELTGGGNEGGGDVNIDIDLSTTNSWLSKIYAKVSQIFDKMSDGSDGTGGSILQKGLDSILVKLDELSGMLKKYLSEITGDLDDIKGQLENMTEQEFDEKSDSFLKDMVDMFSEIADVAKGKFPFSIPNDIRILLERIAITPSEPAALYSEDMSGVSVYSDDHRGGSASRDDETDSPGGGGASRPGTGFIDVEHGGDGGSKEPVESKNGAPVFRLPIVIERYHIEEYIVIDMSPFEPVSRMSRSLFMIMYVICLYNLTFKVMGLWGDLVG